MEGEQPLQTPVFYPFTSSSMCLCSSWKDIFHAHPYLSVYGLTEIVIPGVALIIMGFYASASNQKLCFQVVSLLSQEHL